VPVLILNQKEEEKMQKMMEKYNVRIEGIVPLLQHRFDDTAQEDPSKRRTGATDYSEEWEKALYRMEDGTIYQPAEHIEKSMEKAAVNFQIRGKSKKTYKDLVRSALVITPVYIPHISQKFEIDKRRVRVQKAGVLRHRPIFHKWQLEFELMISDEQLPGKVAQEILEYAGKRVGIGDYRPKFGLFRVVRFENQG